MDNSSRGRLSRVAILAAACLLIAGPPNTRADVTGPTSPLYLTGLEFGPGQPNANEIKAVQGSAVTGSWRTYGSQLVIPVQESAPAVSGGQIRTVGGTICSGACTGEYFPIYSGIYDEAGSFISAPPLTAVPLAYPGQTDYLYDGTTDGLRNYALGTLTGNVYAFDGNWENFSSLFTLPPPEGGGSWLGITYDPGSDSLWVSTHNSPIYRVANYTMSGELRSSFIYDGSDSFNLATGLAFDPADGTLWLARARTFGAWAVRLDQYSTAGTFLGSLSLPELQTFDSTGAEFPAGPMAPKSQTISVTQAAPPAAVYGTSFQVAATASSGLAVAVGASGACTHVGSVITMTTGTGNCQVTFDQAGDQQYLAAPQVVQVTSAQKAAQTITVTQGAPATAAYGTSFPVVAVASSALPVAIAASGSCQISGGTVTMTAATGNCIVTFDQAGDANYLVASQVVQTTAATKANQVITVTAGAPPTALFKETYPLAATAPGGQVAIAADGACSYKAGLLKIKNATPKKSTCTVTFDQAGSTLYLAAPQVVQTTTVGQ
jgi:hypothetical protein